MAAAERNERTPGQGERNDNARRCFPHPDDGYIVADAETRGDTDVRQTLAATGWDAIMQARAASEGRINDALQFFQSQAQDSQLSESVRANARQQITVHNGLQAEAKRRTAASNVYEASVIDGWRRA